MIKPEEHANAGYLDHNHILKCRLADIHGEGDLRSHLITEHDIGTKNKPLRWLAIIHLVAHAAVKAPDVWQNTKVGGDNA